MNDLPPHLSPPSPVLPARPMLLDARRQPYEPAVSPRLRVLLFIIFASVALLGATGAYLAAIRFLEWSRDQTYTNQFTLWMFIAHVMVGVALIVPFIAFGTLHLITARNRPNRVAVRLGIAVFVVGILVCLTGLALIQLEGLPQLPTGTIGRLVAYILHAAAPLAAVLLYVLHRRAGPDIKWSWGIAWAVSVGGFILVMGAMHTQDPRKWYAQGPSEGEKYFEPSRTRTLDGNFIPARTLMMDDYCLRCHQDVFQGWFHSAHHFSSFNNPPYRFSVRETRKVALERDGNTRASRWCAGCHDPVPFLSGAFDDPQFDDVGHPTAHAGITCTVCHAITNVNSPTGNGDYTIEEPQHYPLAYSDHALWQWLNNQVVKAKPDFHKKTFLKPFHRTAEFCSTCHKVSIPMALNHYKEFLRGQNHYDSFLVSGVSGHGARSFYYPPEAKTRCAECHMPLRASADFGSRDFDGSGVRKVHDHQFPAANTGLPWLLSREPAHQATADGLRKAAEAHADFLRGTDPEGKDRKLRIDLFGLKEGGTIDNQLVAPLRPELPLLQPGSTYLVEVVIRTLNVGHAFPQGTADSNEIWVEFTARSGERILGRSGALDGPGESGKVDEWAHFVNVLMLDRNGNRINRRNPQDIFTPLYDHQIPPGAAQVVHYALTVPSDVQGPVELKVRLRYRKFDHEYMSLVYGPTLGPDALPVLPIVDLCADEVTLPVAGIAPQVPAQVSPIRPAWQRWNDYGIGCYLEGGVGAKKGELRQAEAAFRHLLTLGEKEALAHAYLNLARVYFDEGRLAEAVEALNQARTSDPPAPWWTVAWFTGLVNAQNGHLDEAIASFSQILDPNNQPQARRFDFTLDYVVINELGRTLFRRAQQEDAPAERDRYLRQAAAQYERALQIEPESLDAHYGLAQCLALLGAGALTGAPSRESLTLEDGELVALARVFTDPQQARAERLAAAAKLSAAARNLGPDTSTPEKPRLALLRLLIDPCRRLYHQETDAPVRAAAAAVLAQLHRSAHLHYRPDDNAKDRTIALYRRTHPAADHASQAIVIYRANRPGAPGLPAAAAHP